MAAFSVAGAGVTAYSLARSHGDRPEAVAQLGPTPPVGGPNIIAELPGPDVTPVPGVAPDTSKPFWSVPYQNWDNKQPRYDQVINGIAVGPTVKTADSGRCSAGEAQYVAVDSIDSRVKGTQLGLKPRYLPNGLALQGREAVECRGKLLYQLVEYTLPAHPHGDRLLKSGKASWFEIEHGGILSISRAFKVKPSIELHVPAYRWFAATIGGHPAAVARPILDAGLGDARVLVWDEQGGVLTVVETLNVSLPDLLRIAEGLFP